MKYFIGASIEGSHLSFYAEMDDPHFSGRWTWADAQGLPVKDNGVIYFENMNDAKEAADALRATGGGLSASRAESITVVEIDI